MKLAILNDTHIGCRGDSNVFLLHQENFFSDLFFPELEKMNVNTILHLGDIFDRRKYVNFNTLERAKKFFFDPLREKNIEMHIALGNHDVFYTNTNEINSVNLLLGEYKNIHIYEKEPKELQFENIQILMCPWITKDNEEICIKAINNSNANILCGHFGIKGFEMMRGIVAENGMDYKQFKNYEAVYSGHFHHPSEQGNIKYLGAQYEMNWSDAGGRRGFHILDTETRDLIFIENKQKIHHRIDYDEECISSKKIAEMDFSWVENCFVKIVVKQRDDMRLYDLFMAKMNESGAADIKTIEESKDYDLINSNNLLLEDTKNTREIFHEYVDTMETEIDKKIVKNILDELYQEAINI